MGYESLVESDKREEVFWQNTMTLKLEYAILWILKISRGGTTNGSVYTERCIGCIILSFWFGTKLETDIITKNSTACYFK